MYTIARRERETKRERKREKEREREREKREIETDRVQTGRLSDWQLLVQTITRQSI